MNYESDSIDRFIYPKIVKCLVSALICVLTCPFNIFSSNICQTVPTADPEGSVTAILPDTIPLSGPIAGKSAVVESQLNVNTATDSATVIPIDTLDVIAPIELTLPGESNAKDRSDERRFTFTPDPTRAVWLSALCPGLGQLYNRRYWKLPIVIGGFMGLGYATSWNNGMLRDYTRAYSDILDNDPHTKSYMDFFPSTTKEEDLDKTWLTNILKSRKDYYRRNRDLCIICMVGVYLLAMVDAYVDASLAHFDISPDLTVDISPALIPDTRSKLPGVGLQWAFSF